MQSIMFRVERLKKYFPVRKSFFQRGREYVHAVDNVSFYIKTGETLGLVGESGCGKTTLGRCLLMLIKPTSGIIRYFGEDISRLSREKLHDFRIQTAMVFQDPYSSLNPRMMIGDIIGEPMEVHGLARGFEKERQVEELLLKVELPPLYMYKYPHELSGGERQRVCIARALAVKPKFVVLDEPVAALDVSIRVGILNLLKALQKEYSLTYLFISHDLSVIRYISDRIMVMYLGKLVEIAETDELFSNPSHPYTEALISAVPIPDPTIRKKRIILHGTVPTPISPPSGCRFCTRCIYATDKCLKIEPELVEVKKKHFVACHLYA
ncbi:MAG: ABC transporter ATP-binding protein [Candidatus Bathyarchaeia archaeon]